MVELFIPIIFIETRHVELLLEKRPWMLQGVISEGGKFEPLIPFLMWLGGFFHLNHDKT